MTATMTATIQDIIEFIFDNPGSSAPDVAKGLNLNLSDTEDVLNYLDETDGTLKFDNDFGCYTIEYSDYNLADVFKTHVSGGGRDLNETLPTKQASAKPAKLKAKPVVKAAIVNAPKTTKDKTNKNAISKLLAKTKLKVLKGKATTQPAAKPNVTDKPKAKVKVVVDVTKPGSADAVKACVDCKVVYPKFGGMFRPRWKDPVAKNEENPDAKAHAKHVQPRCVDCDKLRSKRKSRFTSLRRMIAIEDIGNADDIVTHPDRKSDGVPDGKFSVACIDDTVDGFTSNLRGVIINHCEGLIKIRWTSGSNPEIIGATKKAIDGSVAPALAPVVAKAKAKAIRAPKASKPVSEASSGTKETKPKKSTKARKPKAEDKASTTELEW